MRGQGAGDSGTDSLVEGRVAGGTCIHAGLLLDLVFVREAGLGAILSKDLELGRRQDRAPLLLGLGLGEVPGC